MKLDLYAIRQLCAYVGSSELDELELQLAGGSLRLRRDTSAPAQRAGAYCIALRAPATGVYLARHPLAELDLAQPGQPVAAGQWVGLLDADGILLPLRCPRAALSAEPCVAPGSRVERGAVLLRLWLEHHT